jgi:Ni,Fe-hydrogenase III large subunit
MPAAFPVWYKRCDCLQRNLNRDCDVSEAVQDILQRIEQIPEHDPLILEARLAEIAEADWKHEAEASRPIALERGIDQAMIDKAVSDGRYPS